MDGGWWLGLEVMDGGWWLGLEVMDGGWWLMSYVKNFISNNKNKY